jgi:hypothetical protein
VTDALPDSRLSLRPDLGSVVVDWPMPDGVSTVRVECVPVFCANCGKANGFCPRDNTAWAFWLCQPCFDVYGAVANTWSQPDAAFWANVHHEMEARFGRVLTDAELALAWDAGQLGRPLELLAKESPYPGEAP